MTLCCLWAAECTWWWTGRVRNRPLRWLCTVQLRSLLSKSVSFTAGKVWRISWDKRWACPHAAQADAVAVDLHAVNFCSVLLLCAYLSTDSVSLYSPACSLFPSQRRPLHSLPASSANSLAPRWSLCPPAWENTSGHTRLHGNVAFSCWFAAPKMRLNKGVRNVSIVPLSRATEALPSCRNGRGRGST